MEVSDDVVRPMSHLQCYRAILSRNFIARQNRKCDMARVAQLLDSRAQLVFRLEQRSILCNFVAEIR